MRNLFILIFVLAALVLMLPFIVGFVLFLILAIIAFMVFIRLGLLPGSTFKIYTSESRRRSGNRPAAQGESSPRPPEGWSQGEQTGEIITLPETALRKDEDDAAHVKESL